jgi:prolyl 4-hydroxylase
MTSLQQAIDLINRGRQDEGIQLLRQVASSGDLEALFMLGDMTWSGNLVEQDPARGRLLFEYAGALGHAPANLLTTNLLANGMAGKRDWTASLNRLAAEARQLPARRRTLELIAAMDLDQQGDPRMTPSPNLVAEEPYARLFEQVLSTAECSYLIETTESRFEPSMVYNKARELVRDTIRTSDGAAIHWLIEDPAIHALNRRIASMTGTRFESGEALQVLRYSPGQEYRPHFDFVEGAQNQRLWTALIYLNNDYEGGETAFVRTGAEVRGKAGDVLVFRNARADGSPDPLAEHAGMPVTSGTKYLATRWIRESRWIP